MKTLSSTLKLFKSLPITEKGKTAVDEELMKKTLKKGFFFSPEVIGNYSKQKLNSLIPTVEKKLLLTSKQMNSSFHKSWTKVKDAKIEQLVMEQIIHYITTYGFEMIGIYDENSVYIPNEKLDIPNLEEDGINLTVIKGYTNSELKGKIIELCKIALKEETIDAVIEIADFIGFDEIEKIKNKETKVILYDKLNLFPENAIEFLRFLVYKATDKTLLIKDKATIEAIKLKNNHDVILKLLSDYKSKYGFENLAEIFYRFKPIFLAFKTDDKLNHHINVLRKLAKKYHRPMKEDYLNSVTKNIETIDEDNLKNELSKVNIFRKIRLAYALKYRTKERDAILYRIRNGNSFATDDFNFKHIEKAKSILDIVIESISNDVITGKKIYIPKNINYTLPATEKQFTGYFPSGTSVSIPADMIFGIHWKNVKGHRIDLDLSLLSANVKYGWDGYYRSEDRDILFSGDVTDACGKNGATELFYVKRQLKNEYILMVNYYNFDENVDVPFEIMVAKQEVKNFKQNYMVNPNNVVITASSNMNQRQKILGILRTTKAGSRFYFAETYLGKSITSGNNDFVNNAKKYLTDFYHDSIDFKDILELAGNTITTKEECEIDLSPEKLEKDTIINLLKKK